VVLLIPVQLGPGTLVKVPASLIKRRKTHIHNLPIGVSVILGNNGYVWLSSLPNGRMPGTNTVEAPSNSTDDAPQTTTAPALEEVYLFLNIIRPFEHS